MNIELIGKDQLVAVALNDGSIELIINAPNDLEFELYGEVYISFVLNRIHIFDKKTEQRVN